MSDNSTPQSSDRAHGAFRSWALQQDLVSLLGGSAEWRRAPEEFGVDASGRPAEDVFRGQGHLRSALSTDPRIALRIRTSIVLWSAAFVTDIANQLSPLAVGMPQASFWPLIVAVFLVILVNVFVYPRLRPAQFFVAEQCVVTFATLLILYQTSVTGGTSSPYMIWFILTAYYAAYLLPVGQAAANLAVISAMCLLTLAFDQTVASNFNLLMLAAMLVTIQVAAIALIRQRRREDTVERAVTFLAMADPLTSTANMRSFEEYFDDLLRSDGQRAALLVVDMNGLKGANSVFGHEVGDDMLIRLARLMQAASDEQDQVARFGGDEFAVLLTDGRAADVTRWREEFEQLIERHNAAARGKLPQISVSIGSAIYPEDGVRVSELIDVADRRMFEEKQTPAAPTYEVDGITSGDAARAFKVSQSRDAPASAVDIRERMNQGAINWFSCGALLLAAAAVGGPYVNAVVAVTLGAIGIAFGAASLLYKTKQLTRTASRVLDVATLVYCLPVIWASGGSSSALIIVLALPISFYAQNFPREVALPRIAILIVGVLGGYAATGAHTQHELTYMFTALAAMLVLAAAMQYSSRQVASSLRLLRSSAQLDRLTGLPNVFALRADLDAAVGIAEHSPGEADPALLVIDLDDFRRANTLGGHRGGDEVLTTVATRLRGASGSAKVYRLGGDKFVILHRGVAGGELRSSGERARAAASHEHVLGNSLLHIEATLAAAEWSPGSTPDEMFERAETMLHSQKVKRRGDERPSGRVLL